MTMQGSRQRSDGWKHRNSGDQVLFALHLLAVLLLFVLVAMTFGFGVQMESDDQSEGITKQETASVTEVSCSKQTTSTVFKDCKDAMSKGYKFTGLFNIKPDVYTSEFEVYCDMESDGGGWTLVASIHEDNIDNKCGKGDKWSKTPASTSNTDRGFENWFNLLTFGDIFVVTGEDYKSKAMYSVNASDVMIWHVPNDLKLSEISDQAFFKYHTTSGFLSKYGSNLQEMFTTYYPMNRIYPKDMAENLITCMSEESWGALWRYLWNRGSSVPATSLIYNDSISVKVDNGAYTNITNSAEYNIGESFKMQARFHESGNKFSALLWFPAQQHTPNIDVKVNWGDFVDNPTLRSTFVDYKTYKTTFVGLCNKTVCKTFFHITNPTHWGREGVGQDVVTFHRYKTNNETGVRMNIDSKGHSVLVGYTTFRKKYENDPTHWSPAVQDLLNCFDEVDVVDFANIPSLSIPANFIKGKMSYTSSDVTPGFIEFRKYDAYGYPFPICPGIRLLNDTDPALHCIGGISSGPTTGNRCGDFAAWNELADHTTQRATSASGKSVTDLTSSLLLFYR